MRRIWVTMVLLVACGFSHAELTIKNLQAGLFVRSPNGAESVIPQRTITGEVGTKFGLRFNLEGKPDAGSVVKYLYLTPGLTTTDGVRHDKLELEKRLLPDQGYHTMAFEFSDNSELCFGPWRLLIFEQDRKLADVEFIVVVPEDNLSITPQ